MRKSLSKIFLICVFRSSLHERDVFGVKQCCLGVIGSILNPSVEDFEIVFSTRQEQYCPRDISEGRVAFTLVQSRHGSQ
jgi:hypothetical protein